MSVTDQSATRNYLGVKFQIDKIDYDANSNAIYIGLAPRGTLTSMPQWIIYQFFYDASSRYTGSLCAGGGQIWDQRVNLVYS
jgi:hypothetical protein